MQTRLSPGLQRFSFVESAVVQNHYVEALAVVSAELLDQQLKHLGMQVRQFQKEILSSQGANCSIEIEVIELVAESAYGLQAQSRDPVAHDRQQSTAALILNEDFYLAVDAQDERFQLSLRVYPAATGRTQLPLPSFFDEKGEPLWALLSTCNEQLREPLSNSTSLDDEFRDSL